MVSVDYLAEKQDIFFSLFLEAKSKRTSRIVYAFYYNWYVNKIYIPNLKEYFPRLYLPHMVDNWFCFSEKGEKLIYNARSFKRNFILTAKNFTIDRCRLKSLIGFDNLWFTGYYQQW